jgi:antitoxin component YwqK of YwqJK toxin-antitoxin module
MRYIILFFLLIPFLSSAQETEGTVGDFFSISTPLTLSLDKTEDYVAPKKKKRKKNVYYGIKTKKGFASKGIGQNEELELFNYLKAYQAPDKYVRDIYWFDFERKQIRRTRTFDPAKGVLLHGPYIKKRGEIIIEEGIFYVGTKHGRWVKKDKNDILVDKEGYYKGWPKESLVRFYDKERTKIKEILPIEYGKKEGNYYYFFENGSIAMTGEFQLDQRVGKWSEFYANRRGRKKREIQYRKNPYDKEFTSYIIKEWNSKGQVVYDHAKDKR